MLEYWRNPEATAKKFAGDWMLSGDIGSKDEKGYLWFKGRADDVITWGGYRIGPGEIEECLMKHPAVALVGVGRHPRPDAHRNRESFVPLRPESSATGLTAETGKLREDATRGPRISARGRVRDRAAAHHDRQDHAPRAGRIDAEKRARASLKMSALLGARHSVALFPSQTTKPMNATEWRAPAMNFDS